MSIPVAAPAAPAAGTLRFALASCQYPGGLLDKERSRAAIDRLVALPAETRPQFLIQPGDQIYADATAGLFDPARADFARIDAYDEVTLLVDCLVRKRIRLLTMLDDHEIADNWEPAAQQAGLAALTAPGATAAERRAAANLLLMHEGAAAYAAAMRRLGPGRIGAYVPGTTPLWYTHASQGHRFFFADTRTTRTFRNHRTWREARLIGDAQWEDLKTWLRDEPAAGLSFVISPSILLPRRLDTAREPLAALRSDAWDGYPASLHALLATLCEHGSSRIVFLSGDEHLGCIARFRVSRCDGAARPVTALSIHGPALYAPFPFANGAPQAFAASESFDFTHAQGGAAAVSYRCDVEATFPSLQNGFALLAASAAGGGAYALDVGFYGVDSAAAVSTQRFAIPA